MRIAPGGSLAALIGPTLALMIAIKIVASSTSGSAKSLDHHEATLVKLPALFNFELYQRLFAKTYSSHTEATARHQIFLARALRVFVASIEYKRRFSTSYKALNHLSDRFEGELKRMALWESGRWRDAERDIEAPLAPSDLAEPIELELRELATMQVQDLDATTMSQDERWALGLIREEILRLSSSSGTRARFKRATVTRSAQAALNRSTDQLDERERLTDKLINAHHEPLLIDPSATRPAELEPAGLANGNGLQERIPVRELQWWEYGSISEADSDADADTNAPEQPDNNQLLKATQELIEAGKDATSATKGALQADQVFFDHSQSACMGPPRDQGASCGSCYAFAAITIMEWLYCRRTGKLAKFSEQYLVDCGPLVGASGCEGGTWEEVGNFVENFGLELRHKYRYVGRQNACPYLAEAGPLGAISEPSHERHRMGWIRMRLQQGNKISIEHWADYISYSPMFVSLDLDAGFHEYANGVYRPLGCGDERHAMVLVGHGREAGHDYWLLRNSYGTNWGAQGYFKLSKQSDCFYPKYATIYGEIDEQSEALSYQVSRNELHDGQAIRSKYKRRPVGG